MRQPGLVAGEVFQVGEAIVGGGLGQLGSWGVGCANVRAAEKVGGPA